MLSQIALLLSRMIKEPAVHTTAAMVSLPATAAGLHAMGVSTDIDVVDLATGLAATQFWAVIAVAALFGAIGGVVAELLTLHGNVELPHSHRRGAPVRRARLA